MDEFHLLLKEEQTAAYSVEIWKRFRKWGISERRVQKLCEEGRIPGVAHFSRMWLIPIDAEKPKDRRKKS